MTFRPDVLVTDWMLQSHIHGLHVAAVLQTVSPDLRTILMTGFGTLDLAAEAKRSQVRDYIEKPFDLARICAAVRRACQAPGPCSTDHAIGVAEAETSGKIVHANPAARQMFGETCAGADADHLADLLGPEAGEHVRRAVDEWIEVAVHACQPRQWYLRTRIVPRQENMLLILIPRDREHLITDPIVSMLLAAETQLLTGWPLAGRVMIVEDEPSVRRVVTAQLARCGCLCHTAATADQAIRIFQRDPGINVVILDYEMPDTTPALLVRKLRALRPRLLIVGTSGSGHQGDFEAIGVFHYLQKPWHIDDLIRLVS